MTIISRIRTLNIVIDHLDGTISRGPIDNQVRNIGIILLEHAVECALQHFRGLIGNGDVGDGHYGDRLEFIVYCL